MKITINRDEILSAFQKVQSIVSPKTTLPVLSNVLFRVENDKLYLTSTNLEMSVRSSVNAQVEKEGSTTLPAKKILSIFRELPNYDIIIESDENNVSTIRCGTSFFKILGIKPEDFPSLPKFEGGYSYQIDQAVLKDMLRKTGYAASTEETRYVLNGTLMSFKGEKLIVVATDGRRLALTEKEIEFPEIAEANLVLPTKAVNELIHTLGDKGMVKIMSSNNQVAFEFDEMLVVSKLIDAIYPNYSLVIPDHTKERIAVEREGLLTAAKRVALISNDEDSSIKLIFGQNRVEFTSVKAEVGEAREQMPVKYNGPEIIIDLGPFFLIEPLKILEADEVYLEVSDNQNPCVLKSDNSFLYVLMPMRMK